MNRDSARKSAVPATKYQSNVLPETSNWGMSRLVLCRARVDGMDEQTPNPEQGNVLASNWRAATEDRFWPIVAVSCDVPFVA